MDMTGGVPCRAVLCCAVLQCIEYLSWDRRLMMLHDVAAGMSYLHGRNHIHGDLRSPNLFVGADGKVRTAGRGFTRTCDSCGAATRWERKVFC